MNLLIKNGRVIDPESKLDELRDVLIEGDKVAAIEHSIEKADVEIFDAAGLIVAPGFLDIHVHLREPGIEHAETIESGARAAAAGGFTTICCMPNTIPVNDSAQVTSFIMLSGSFCLFKTIFDQAYKFKTYRFFKGQVKTTFTFYWRKVNLSCVPK